MIQFNLSPSSINLYNESPLRFYFKYIAKIEPDTKVFRCYGDAGNVVHKTLEKYVNDNSIDYIDIFNKYWHKYNLDDQAGINGQTLNKDDYLKALELGIDFLKNLDTTIISEEQITIPFINTENAKINITGIIDLQIINEHKNEYIILDWKTSSSVDSGENFKTQVLHYAYLVWKKYNRIPTECIVYYLKIGRVKYYYFNESELIEYENFLKEFVEKILEKGENIDEYELGNIDSIFNEYREMCYKEKYKRQSKIIKFTLIEYGNFIQIKEKLSPKLINYLDNVFSYEDKNSYYIRQHTSWDGINRLFNKRMQLLGIGFKEMLKQKLIEYGKKFDKYVEFNIIDYKAPLKQYEGVFPDKLIGKELRDYQKRAVEKFINEKIGIIQIGTGGGKTEIAIESIRRLKLKTLFIVHKKELLKQTKSRIESSLGINCGVIGMSEFNPDIVTVATIQTLYRKINTAEVKNFLNTIQFVIVDECHIIAAKSFRKVLRMLPNTHYRLGLSATAFRDDGHDMLIQEGVGEIIFDLSAVKLSEMGYVFKPKIIFYHVNQIPCFDDTYIDDYNNNIVDSDIRNQLIVELVNKYYNKKILILTKQVRHGRMLNEMIPGSFHLHGNVNNKIRSEYYDKFLNGEIRVMIATLSIASEGLDIPSLDIIINAGANYGNVKSIQILGRVMRKYMNKDEAIYIDFFDVGKYTKKHSRTRFKLFQQLGYDVILGEK